MIRTSLVALILTCAAGPVLADEGDYDKVMGSVHVGSGEHVNKATTVNGSVDIGSNAVVQHAETVNGSVTIHDNATVDSVQTVNGSITLDEGVHVAGKVDLVNGKITVGRGSVVGGRLSTVNGAILISAAHVVGRVETTNSNLTVGANSRLDGGILYQESSDGWFSFLRQAERTENHHRAGRGGQRHAEFRRAVELYVSDRATIGTVKGATVNKFSGAHP